MHLPFQHRCPMRITTGDLFLIIINFLIDSSPSFELFIQFAFLFGSDHVVSFDENSTNTKQIEAWINAAGFQAALVADKAPPPQKSATAIPWTAIPAWLILIPFLVGMVGMAFGKHSLMMTAPIQFALATIVQFVSGSVFYKGAFSALKSKAPNMDVLVALGTTVVWAYSVLMLVMLMYL